MRKIFIVFAVFTWSFLIYSQNKTGHYNESMFKELDEILPTPNHFRTAAGAPGPGYYQQKADYKMKIELNEAENIISGEEIITYHNLSPDVLEYLWVQLDQNIHQANGPTKLVASGEAPKVISPRNFSKNYIEQPFDGGFRILEVKDLSGKDLKVVINQTMMRVDLEKPLRPKQKYQFKIKWWYRINDYTRDGGRSGYEPFPDGNNLYVIAQFFPRMAVYNDVEGWQNMQFWGRSEFALPFGDYEVDITVPADHLLNGTGEIINLKELISPEHFRRWQLAQRTYDNPVIIFSQLEVEKIEKGRSTEKKTWKLRAKNVRDFAFSTSRKFIWDAMAVNINGKKVMAISLYPKEGNPLWEKYSTRVVAHTLKTYSKYTFDYPYSKAISVNARDQGMEYPMICWNYGRPDANGFTPNHIKHGMISVIIHEVGHNFFPMIINSDERQWTWMDEGLNTFLQFISEQELEAAFPDEFNSKTPFPSRRGFAKDIVEYMSMDQSVLEPIMTQGDHLHNFGANAYGKPATALNILRTTIMGKELFDHAFRMYAQRWKFKHPTPADFFRTMEDASGVDLDWFWRGWFFTTHYCDIEIEKVRELFVSEDGKQLRFSDEPNPIEGNILDKFSILKEYVESLPEANRKNLKNPRFFYEIEFSKPGGLIMPILLTFYFEDGSKEEIRIPYYIWRLHENRNLKKFFVFEKKVVEIVLDEKLETADINTEKHRYKL